MDTNEIAVVAFSFVLGYATRQFNRPIDTTMQVTAEEYKRALNDEPNPDLDRRRKEYREKELARRRGRIKAIQDLWDEWNKEMNIDHD